MSIANLAILTIEQLELDSLSVIAKEKLVKFMNRLNTKKNELIIRLDGSLETDIGLFFFAHYQGIIQLFKDRQLSTVVSQNDPRIEVVDVDTSKNNSFIRQFIKQCRRIHADENELNKYCMGLHMIFGAPTYGSNIPTQAMLFSSTQHHNIYQFSRIISASSGAVISIGTDMRLHNFPRYFDPKFTKDRNIDLYKTWCQQSQTVSYHGEL